MSRQYTDIMIDIETLGTAMDSTMLSISAVPFNLHGDVSANTFDMYIDIDDAIRHGRSVSGSTFVWWLHQSKDARDTQISADRFTLSDVLSNFKTWYDEQCEKNKVHLHVWGNGAKFDLGIITSSYESIGSRVPWLPWFEQDVRTIVRFAPGIKKSLRNDFTGIAHNGLDDCRHQIRYLTETLKFCKLV